MISIYIKIIVMFLLAVAPFAYAGWSGRKKHSLPRMIQRFYEGMKKSENFRKFFTLIVLMGMLALQFIDFQATTTIAKMIQESAKSPIETAQTIGVYAPLMTRPYATLIAAAVSLSFFSFKVADRVLTVLHQQPKVFLLVGLVAMTIMFTSVRYLILAQMLFVILFAAQVYPNHIGNNAGQRMPHISLRCLFGHKFPRVATN